MEDESVDPRETITHELEPGNIYEDDRTGTRMVLVYISDHVVLLRYEERNDDGKYYHRLERRRQFEENVGSGRYDLDGTAEVEGSGLGVGDPVELEEVSGIGAKTAERLRNAGYALDTDIERASDEELLDIGGVGAGNLENLREHIE